MGLPACVLDKKSCSPLLSVMMSRLVHVYLTDTAVAFSYKHYRSLVASLTLTSDKKVTMIGAFLIVAIEFLFQQKDVVDCARTNSVFLVDHMLCKCLKLVFGNDGSSVSLMPETC